jgi:hypothetical protein
MLLEQEACGWSRRSVAGAGGVWLEQEACGWSRRRVAGAGGVWKKGWDRKRRRDGGMHARTLARTNDARMYMRTLPRARKRARATATKTDGDASTRGGWDVATGASTKDGVGSSSSSSVNTCQARGMGHALRLLAIDTGSGWRLILTSRLESNRRGQACGLGANRR